MIATALLVLYTLIGYLVGSVSCAIIVCRLFGFPDPRTEGSNNPGATNVLRLAGKKFAILVLFGDMLKGFLPVFILHLWGEGPVTLGFVCLATVLGHMYPVFFKFKGGKGVATALGALLGLHWILGAAVIATWLVVALLSHYSSLASILTMVLAPFYSLAVTRSLPAFVPLALMAMAVLYKHNENITRLMTGKEPKINLKRSKASAP
jgi:glycerol-3-phosphate acyltransferase PlsY